MFIRFWGPIPRSTITIECPLTQIVVTIKWYVFFTEPLPLLTILGKRLLLKTFKILFIFLRLTTLIGLVKMLV